MMHFQMKSAWKKWLLVLLFVLIAVCIWRLLSIYTGTDRSMLYLTPTFQDARSWEIYTMAEDGTCTELTPREILDIEYLETFYLSRTIPEEWESGGYSFLLLDSDRPSSVFIDGELLYSTCPNAGRTIGQIFFPDSFKGLSQRGEAIRFTIPGGSVGKIITIATTHFNVDFGLSLPGIKLSSEATEAAVWMSTANHSTMPAAAFAVSAVLLFGLLCYSLFHGIRNWSLLLLAATACCHLFYYLRQYSFSSPSFSPLDTPLAAFLPMLTILLPELYLLLQMKRHKKLRMILMLTCGALSFVPPVVNLFGKLSFSTTPFVETQYIGLLALLVFAVSEARRKNKVFQLFLYGLGIACTCVLISCFLSLLGNRFFVDYVVSLMSQIVRHDPMLFLYWCGTFLFAMASALSVYQLIRYTADTQTELAVQTERLARLDYELFMQKEIYEAKLANEEELRALRHDIKGHLFTLSELLSDNKIKESASYISGLTKQHQERQSEIFCSNPYMNAVLRTHSLRFKENNIPFSCLAGIDSRTLPGIELCLILNNALENALEASIKQQERLVKLQARIWHEQFLLRVSNRFDGTLHEYEGLPVSTKTEKGHGYGMANIRSTVQRLGGEMNYQIEDSFFVLDVRFPT